MDAIPLARSVFYNGIFDDVTVPSALVLVIFTFISLVKLIVRYPSKVIKNSYKNLNAAKPSEEVPSLTIACTSKRKYFQ